MDVAQKRVFIVDGKLTDRHPLMFECERNGPSEKSRVIYDAAKDCFFQMQESSSETSMFIERAVLKETKVFTLT